MEHQLKIYPLSEPMAQKRRPMASEGRLALKEKIFCWLKKGLIRKVQHPEWITNAIPIKLADGTWKVRVDYSSLNKVCARDMYPFPKEGEELSSLMRYLYKCFLRILKEYSQIRMAEDDEEKTRFHTEEGVYYFTHMLKELKNSAAMLQRMMEKVLADQRGRNVEIYLEEIVIKSKSELDLVQDVEETLRKLKRVNIKIDLATSSFRVEEGRFLGHTVTKEGVRADPEKGHAIILSPTPKSPNKIQNLFLQLTVIRKFIPKMAELPYPIRMVREGEIRMLCICHKGETISSVLLVEKEGIQIPISNASRLLQGMEICYTPTEKMVHALIHMTRSLNTIFRKHKVRVVTDGPMKEILKLFRKEGRLARWAAEIRTYDISYIPRKEAEGS
ncbi:reverse transcriptase domain-containing protein [Tanacetum coccineum]